MSYGQDRSGAARQADHQGSHSPGSNGAVIDNKLSAAPVLLPQLLPADGSELDSASGRAARERQQDPFSHDALVPWMLANLQEPISLSDLERPSRRSRQYTFRQRHGCGPTQ